MWKINSHSDKIWPGTAKTMVGTMGPSRFTPVTREELLSALTSVQLPGIGDSKK